MSPSICFLPSISSSSEPRLLCQMAMSAHTTSAKPFESSDQYQHQSVKMQADTNKATPAATTVLTSTSTSTERPRRPRQQHHWDRTYQCMIVYSEYDCGHELSQIVRDPRCWKCEEIQPRRCWLSCWDIGADGLCPECDIIKRGEELARQRRLARGLVE